MRINWKEAAFNLLMIFGIVYFGTSAEDRAYLRQPHVMALELSLFIAIVGAGVLVCLVIDAARGPRTLRESPATNWINYAVGAVLMLVGMSEISGGHRTGNTWKGLIFGGATIIAGIVVFMFHRRRKPSPEPP